MTHNVQGYMMQGENIILLIDNKTHTVNRNTHFGCFDEIVKALGEGDMETVERLVDAEKMVEDYGNGDLSLVDEVLHYKGRPMANALSTRVVAMIRSNQPFEFMIKFIDNLMANPSKRAIDEIYTFMENNALPITPDGYILAYKGVNANYRDKRTDTFDNSVGAENEMPRNEVDDNPRNTCSSGLHISSLDYASHWAGDSGKLMIVKVNPKDIVCIPYDYNHQKVRTCRYTVVGEHNVRDGKEGIEALSKGVQDVTTADS